MIKILFLGQKLLGERCFDLILAEQSVRVCGVVTNPRADNVWWQSNRIHQTARDLGIASLSNERRNHKAIKTLIREHGVNTIISVQHSWILPADIISMVEGRAFNLHNAKLPDYKGYNSCNHAIANGDTSYTSTLHWMTEEVDEGDIAFEAHVDIDPHDTAESLYRKSNEAAPTLIELLLACLREGRTIPRIPVTGAGTFYPRASLEQLRQIENPTDLVEVDRKSRALYFPPFEPAYFQFQGKKIYVLPQTFPFSTIPKKS